MQTNQLIERNGEPVVWIEIGAGNEAPRRANPWKDSLLFLLFLFGVKHSSPGSIVEKGMLQLHSTKDTGTTRVSRTSTARRKREGLFIKERDMAVNALLPSPTL